MGSEMCIRDRFSVALDVTRTWPSKDAKEEEMARLMPLFLKGRAYTTWKRLSEAEREDLTTVKTALRRVYGLSKVEAWRKIKSMRLLPGDPVDVLADELSELLKIVLEADPPDTLIAVTFIDALPSNLAEQITLLHGENMDLRGIVSSAKSLRIGQDGAEALAAAAMGSNEPTRSQSSKGRGQEETVPTRWRGYQDE